MMRIGPLGNEQQRALRVLLVAGGRASGAAGPRGAADRGDLRCGRGRRAHLVALVSARRAGRAGGPSPAGQAAARSRGPADRGHSGQQQPAQ